MIIKKFQAPTESDAIKLARDELGKDAIIMHVKTITPKGLYRIFKKKSVEVTAAVDDNVTYQESGTKVSQPVSTFSVSTDQVPESPAASESDLQSNIDAITNLIAKQIKEQQKNKEGDSKNDDVRDSEKSREKESVKKEDPSIDDEKLACISLIYNKLIDNEVDEIYANKLMSEIEPTIKKDAPVENVLAAVYQKIVLKLGVNSQLEPEPGKTKFCFFAGPTGVGKTTTIAKLASTMKLTKKLNVALITADTYRIAAVNQLETYANILGIPLKVALDASEIKKAAEELKGYDIVLIDTAGRSHKSASQRDDLEKLINSIPEEDREVYLVLSVATKYRDLVKICETYKEFTSYRIIFTKLDETTALGNIYNIRQLTGAQLSYVTFGQAVPNDIEKIDAQTIAKQLLGGNE